MNSGNELNYNFFVDEWVNNFEGLFRDRKEKKKTKNFRLQEFLEFLFIQKNKESTTWIPSLYENCIHQTVSWNIFKRIIKKVKEREIRIFLGSNLYFTNVQVNLTGIENLKTISQKHLTPVYYATIRSFEKSGIWAIPMHRSTCP